MMTAFLGFLFNRFSFFLLVLAVIAALVFFGKLIWNKFTIGGLVLLALGIGLWTYHDKLIKDDRIAIAAPYIKLIKDNNDAAVAKLAAETAKTDAATKAFKEFSTQQEKADVKNVQTIVTLNSKLRAAGRLRDPHQARCSGGRTEGATVSSPESGAGHGAETGGLLSTELSGLLARLTSESDTINVAYIACRADIYKVRELIAENASGGIILAMSEWTK